MQNTQELSDSSPPANNINHSPQPPGPVVYITPTPTLSPISSYGHYSPQSQAYSLQQHRTNLFPQLFSEIANQSREQLNDVTFYTPSASNSPLMLDTIYFLFDYFVRNFGAGMSLVSRLPPNPEILYNSEDRRGRENFWTYDAPLMALNNPHILNAMLALSSLHYSRVNKDAALDPVAFNSMTYYQNAVRGLRESIVVQKHTDTLATLTTCLLLAFYETMYGDLMKWYTHMAGAKDIIVNWGLCKVASGARDLYDVGEISEFLSPTEIKALQTADLVSMFLYMDLLQSTIGSSQMLLSLEDIDLLPLRGAPSSKVFIFDSLVKCSAKISSWVASEHVRKEKLYPKNEPHPELTKEDYMNLAQATILWESLRDELQTLETRFGPYIAPLPLRGPPVLTPFGPSSVYKSAFDMFLTTFLHMNWLIIKRNRPDIPTFGMETLRYAAEDGVPHLIVIFRSLPPVIPPAFAHSNDENLDSGQTIRLVIEISVAAFFAGIQVRDPAQQKWVEWWFQQCYQYTGWSTAQTIIQGIKRGWGAQKAAIERMMEARERSAGSSPSHASSSPSASEDTLSPLPNSGSSPISMSEMIPDQVPENFTPNERKAFRATHAKGLL